MEKESNPIVESNFIVEFIKSHPGIRRSADGTFWLPRKKAEICKVMDAYLTKIGTGVPTWKVKTLDAVDVLKNRYQGKEATIIGKGKSLDYLRLEHLGSGPVFAINEAILKVEQLRTENVFGITQDISLQDKCRPKKAALMVSHCAASWYVGHSPLLGFRTEGHKITALYAIEFAKLAGCTSFRMIAFDGITSLNTEYAQVVGSTPVGNTQRFIEFKARIVAALEDYPTKWLTPEPIKIKINY